MKIFRHHHLLLLLLLLLLISEKSKQLIDKLILNQPEAVRFEQALQSFHHHWENEFSKEKDIHNIHGEKNIFRYLPLKKMVFRIYEQDSLLDVLLVLHAASLVKTGLLISCDPSNTNLEKIRTITAGFELLLEEELHFTENISRYERIRTCSTSIPIALYQQAASTGVYIANARPVGEGRIELLHYLREQSISYEYHRYGNIIEN